MGAVCLVCLLVLARNNLAIPDHEQPNDRIYYSIALDFKSPDICEKINPASNQRLSGFFKFGRYRFFQADCYYASAVKLHDASLCEKIKKPWSAFTLKDAYDYSEDHCERIAASGDRTSDYRLQSELPLSLAPFFHALGYTSENTKYAQDYWRSGQENNSEGYIEQLLGNPTFVEKVASGLNYSEPFDPNKFRAPTSLEMIYSYVGQRLRRKDLCEKISPNARVPKPGAPGGDSIPAKSCWYTYAVATQDKAICDQVDSYGPNYLTSKDCHLELDAWKETNSAYWPVHGDRYDFSAALKELGFPIPDDFPYPHKPHDEDELFRSFYEHFSGAYAVPDVNPGKAKDPVLEKAERDDFLTRVRNM